MPKRRSRRAEILVNGRDAPVKYRANLKMKPEMNTAKANVVMVKKIYHQKRRLMG
jgi:hypothetical protein